MEILRPYYHRVRRAGRSSEGGHRKKGGDKDNHPATSGGGFTTEESKLKWLEPAAWWKKSKTDGSWMKLSEVDMASSRSDCDAKSRHRQPPRLRISILPTNSKRKQFESERKLYTFYWAWFSSS